MLCDEKSIDTYSCMPSEPCTKCELYKTRKHVVEGAGDLAARIMLIGEAPGRNEDEQGVPFVGAAGKRLTALLEDTGIRREDIYITNILKCRPPNNRDPEPQEIKACTPYLNDQIEHIDPHVLVTLGNFATRYILKTNESITALHGRLFKGKKRYVYPVYHPAAAIYDPSKQQALELDFKRLDAFLRQRMSEAPTKDSHEHQENV